MRGGWWRPKQRLALVVLLTLVASPAVGSSALAASPGGTQPSALWKAFPLNVPTPRVFTPPTAGRQSPVANVPATIPAAVVRSPGSSGSGLFVSAGIAILVLGAAGAAVIVLRGPARRWSRATAAAMSPGRLRPTQAYAFASSALREAEQSYLLVRPGRMGLREVVVERMGVPPSLGEVIFDKDLGRASQAYVVEGIGPSPLPGDRRPCAILRAL